MDDRVRNLKTPQDCETFARNATDKGRPDLAAAARQRAIELRAAAYGAKSDAERECVEAIYAYEATLFAKHGKRIRASRTWQMIKRRGIIAAVEQAVDRPDGTAGFSALKDAGLEKFAFEVVIARHPSLFSQSAVDRSRQRLAQFGDSATFGASGKTQHQWSSELRDETRRVLSDLPPFPDGRIHMKHIDGGTGYFELPDLVAGKLMLRLDGDARGLTFADADEAIVAGWAVD